MIVNAIICEGCRTVVYSRNRHDMRDCLCGKMSIDGGRDCTRILCREDVNYELIYLSIPYSNEELQADYYHGKGDGELGLLSVENIGYIICGRVEGFRDSNYRRIFKLKKGYK